MHAPPAQTPAPNPRLRWAGWLLVALYGIGLVQPALPVLSFWANQEFYATQRCVNRFQPELAACCQGQCQLQKQLQQAEEEQPASPVLPSPAEQMPEAPPAACAICLPVPPLSGGALVGYAAAAPLRYTGPALGLLKPPPQPVA